MSKHRKMSDQSRRARTVVGGVIAGGALALVAPAGLAMAVPNSASTGNASADAVGRPGFDNPAPGVRAAQAIGDKVFNDSTPFNSALNGSVLGTEYHQNFGTTSVNGIAPGTNGTVISTPRLIPQLGPFTGQLNNTGGKQIYDGLQAAGLGLPAEKDLPGTIPKLLVGGGGSAASKSTTASKSKGGTTLSVQGIIVR